MFNCHTLYNVRILFVFICHTLYNVRILLVDLSAIPCDNVRVLFVVFICHTLYNVRIFLRPSGTDRFTETTFGFKTLRRLHRVQGSSEYSDV